MGDGLAEGGGGTVVRAGSAETGVGDSGWSSSEGRMGGRDADGTAGVFRDWDSLGLAAGMGETALVLGEGWTACDPWPLHPVKARPRASAASRTEFLRFIGRFLK